MYKRFKRMLFYYDIDSTMLIYYDIDNKHHVSVSYYDIDNKHPVVYVIINKCSFESFMCGPK